MAEIKGYRKNIEVENQISIFKKIISIHEVLTNSKMSVAEKDVLSYYCTFKGEREADEMIIKDKIVGSMQVLYNMKSKLKKKKLLMALAKKKLKVCDSLDFDVINNSSFVMSKITAANIVVYDVGDLKREIINVGFEFKERLNNKGCNVYKSKEYELHHYYFTDDIELYKEKSLIHASQIKTENELRIICSKLMT